MSKTLKQGVPQASRQSQHTQESAYLERPPIRHIKLHQALQGTPTRQHPNCQYPLYNFRGVPKAILYLPLPVAYTNANVGNPDPLPVKCDSDVIHAKLMASKLGLQTRTLNREELLNRLAHIYKITEHWVQSTLMIVPTFDPVWRIDQARS
ncbi:hypothetical protein CIHG_09992 [Coccidioides immitis H538.4]|uniref:Uncharacterized protein n=1 Tax=Coccidioides immitis H538.4 TaxID=396776 RepID=A0A0J8S439_COCIT|nr:hypothetical protein CIHG_09992 [Coccidioides immitis H538.4]